MSVPRPGSLVISIPPPWSSTIFFAIGRPRPVPTSFVEK